MHFCDEHFHRLGRLGHELEIREGTAVRVDVGPIERVPRIEGEPFLRYGLDDGRIDEL